MREQDATGRPMGGEEESMAGKSASDKLLTDFLTPRYKLGESPFSGEHLTWAF